jgi:hypothetical protein
LFTIAVFFCNWILVVQTLLANSNLFLKVICSFTSHWQSLS